jgi:hypothetical protein
MNVRFEVFVNGERICIAGFDSFGVMTAVLTSVERNPEKAKNLKTDRSLESLVTPEVDFHVGGLDCADADAEWSVTWANLFKLSPGDEIRIKILPAGESDPPRKKTENPCSCYR